MQSVWRWPSTQRWIMLTVGIHVTGEDLHRFGLMTREKIIDCIGASDEDVAHLRLLLRTAGAQLHAPWHWGHEAQADLVIVDADNLVGFAARARVLQRGVPCAELIAPDAPEPDGLFLRKPLRREDLVVLLNGSGQRAIAPFSVLSQGDNFFDVDLGEYEDAGAVSVGDGIPARTLGGVTDELDEFEALFKRDALADTPQVLLPDRLEDATSVEYTGERTTRSLRNSNERKPFINDSVLSGNIDPSMRSFAHAVDEGAHLLRDYLVGPLLGGVSEIVLPGLPMLVLDPKRQVYHAEGDLPALEEYFEQPLQRADWRALLSEQMREVRERFPAQPYVRLHWLERMLAANGYLSQHLDPGGSYRLTRVLEIAKDYPRAFRIGAAMVGQPLRLHEIVGSSDTSMAEVFSVVSAYDAIGWVEWQLRERFLPPIKPSR